MAEVHKQCFFLLTHLIREGFFNGMGEVFTVDFPGGFWSKVLAFLKMTVVKVKNSAIIVSLNTNCGSSDRKQLMALMWLCINAHM